MRYSYNAMELSIWLSALASFYFCIVWFPLALLRPSTAFTTAGGEGGLPVSLLWDIKSPNLVDRRFRVLALCKFRYSMPLFRGVVKR